MAQLLLTNDDIQHIIAAHIKNEYGRDVVGISFASNPAGTDSIIVRSACVTFGAKLAPVFERGGPNDR